jgi:uncharacterized membrane protein YdcZ (DUF606 family)
MLAAGFCSLIYTRFNAKLSRIIALVIATAHFLGAIAIFIVFILVLLYEKRQRVSVNLYTLDSFVPMTFGFLWITHGLNLLPFFKMNKQVPPTVVA